MKRWLLICLLFAQLCHGQQLAIEAKANGRVPIQRLQIFSERCSGSFFFWALVHTNILTLDGRTLAGTDYGHKHFPKWLELPSSIYKGNPQRYTFAGSEDTLFLILFRDPYDWLRSLNRNPWHAVSSLDKLPFSKFIRQEWRINPKDSFLGRDVEENPYLDLNPLTGKPFKNVMELRSAKIRTMLEIARLVDNVYVINYETVCNHQEEVLREISECYGLKKKEPFLPVIAYKGMEEAKKYKPVKYVPISQKDLKYINRHLDHELEELIGYKILNQAAELNRR